MTPKFDIDEIRDVIFTWLSLIEERVEEGGAGPLFERIAPLVPDLKLAADKSNYLSRRFSGQEHRTERCPVHKGRWAGYGYCKYCSLGIYDRTGWVTEPEDVVDIGICGFEGCDKRAVSRIVSIKTGRREEYVRCEDHGL